MNTRKTKMKRSSLALVAFTILALATTPFCAEPTAKSSRGSRAFQADETLEWWNHVGNKTHRHGQRLPEDKYDFKVQKDQRTFAENLLHVAAVDYDRSAGSPAKASAPILARTSTTRRARLTRRKPT